MQSSFLIPSLCRDRVCRYSPHMPTRSPRENCYWKSNDGRLRKIVSLCWKNRYVKSRTSYSAVAERRLGMAVNTRESKMPQDCDFVMWMVRCWLFEIDSIDLSRKYLIAMYLTIDILVLCGLKFDTRVEYVLINLDIKLATEENEEYKKYFTKIHSLCVER